MASLTISKQEPRAENDTGPQADSTDN